MTVYICIARFLLTSWVGLLAWLGLSLLLQAPATAARDLTLIQCIDLAVKNDPQTQNARQKVEIAKLKRDKAIQDFYPKLDVYVTRGPQTDYFGQPVTQNNIYYTGVGIEQPLYKGGNLTNGVKLAESETSRQEQEYLFRKLAVAAEAVKAYYEAMTEQAKIQQFEALLRYGQEDLREAQARLAAGRGTRLDVLDLSVKLLEVQQRLSKARADFQVKLSALNRLVGFEEGTSLSLVRQFPLVDIQGDESALLSEAQARRPDLKASHEDVNYNQLKTQIEDGKRWPQLSFVARHEWESPTFFSGKKDWMIMLKASVSLGNSTLSYSEQRNELYPNPYAFPQPPGFPNATYVFPVRQLRYSLFDRSSNKVELEEARAARDLSQNRWAQMRLQVNLDVKDAYSQKADSSARMVTAQQQITMARELVGINQIKYGSGMTTLAEVFKARATLAEAEVNLATAQNDRATALGKLYQAVGRDMVFKEKGP
ncbi:MAG: TolC family protein [Thermodesulfobacteriota bacterium]